MILVSQNPVDLVVLTEEDTPRLRERCIKLYVQIVVKNAKFLSDQKKEGQFTAKNVILNINLRGFNIEVIC